MAITTNSIRKAKNHLAEVVHLARNEYRGSGNNRIATRTTHSKLIVAAENAIRRIDQQIYKMGEVENNDDGS